MRILIFIALLCAAVQGRGQIYINSYRFGGAQLLLDAYPTAVVGYSLRKLTDGYNGNCIEVRRASDNTTSNIGFLDNYLDTASLKTFCSGTNCFVRTWYDQSGNSRNLTQTTNLNQPTIVTSGAILYQNNRVAINFTGSSVKLSTDTSSAYRFTGGFFMAQLNSFNTYNQYMISASTVSDANANNGWWLEFGSARGFTMFNNGNEILADNTVSITGLSINTSYLFVFDYNNSNVIGYYNNTQFGSSSQSNLTIGATGRRLVLGGADSFNTYPLTGRIQEFVIYNSSKSSDRVGIQDNINSFYSIY